MEKHLEKEQFMKMTCTKGEDRMHKIGHKKKFNGKYYEAFAYYRTKAKADAEASLVRKLGHNARVVKHGKEYYLYLRK